MASKIKTTGVLGRLLNGMADRGGHQTCDRRGFPPSKVMNQARKRGLVDITRIGGLTGTKTTVWRLNEAGWAAIDRSPQAAGDR